MKYPAIYKSVEGSEYLYQNKDSYYCYERQLWDSSEPHHDCHHSDTNITAEYLANTYGEVKNKEHAEFIVRLAETNGILIEARKPSEVNWFSFRYILGNLYLTLASNRSSLVVDWSGKQITIPLPAECESEDEWPKVGSKVTWCTKAINGEVRGVDNGLAWIKNDHGNYVTAYISELEKPKTPEQELREFLHLLWRENNEDFDDFADIAVLHLTKKGKGDEF